MKKTFLILAVLAAISPWARSEPNQPSASQGYSVSTANSQVPWWFSNPPSASQSRIYANQSGVTTTASELGARLAALQNDLQQVLPVLSTFNANLPPASPGPSETAPETTAAVPVPTPTGANVSANYGQNTSTRTAANYGQNVSVPVGYTPPSPASASGFSAVVPPTVPPASNPLITPQVPAGTGENEAVTPSTPEAIRQLLTLQAEIQRMLPVVASLNNGGLNLASGVVPASVPRSFAAATNQPALTPTGR